MSLILRAAAVVLLLAPISFGRDIYVHGFRGDDRNTGHSAQNVGLTDGPVRTISRALKLANSGDRVVVDSEGGPYRESISLVGQSHSGAMGVPFIIEGNGAVLDGTESLPPGIWKHYRGDVYRFQLTMQPVNMTYFAIFNNGKMLERIAAPSGVRKLPSLEPNTWCLFDGFIYFRTEGNRSPLLELDYSLSYSARQVGVSLIQVDNVRIHDLEVRGFQVDGISAANGARSVILDNVTCRKNGRSGLTIGRASTVYAGYGTFAENQTTQVLALPFSRGKLYDCQVSEDGITRSDDSELLVEVAEE